MPYPQDPGGKFTSDVHRRVLAHLSHPEDTYGWTAATLLERMRPDVGTDLTDVEELSSILQELESDGHAEQPQDGVWRMTQDGFDVLNGSIENEPSPEDAAKRGTIPATIGVGAATPLNNGQVQIEEEDE